MIQDLWADYPDNWKSVMAPYFPSEFFRAHDLFGLLIVYLTTSRLQTTLSLADRTGLRWVVVTRRTDRVGHIRNTLTLYPPSPPSPSFSFQIHNSLLPLFEEVIDSIFYMAQRMQVYNLHSIEPKKDVVDKQMIDTQEYLKNTVSWDSCHAWYKAKDGVRVSGVWPGDTMSFINCMRNMPKEEAIWRAWRDGKVVEIPASEIVM